MDLSFLGDAAAGLASGGLSAIFGGIIGLAGSWVRQRFELKKADLDLKRQKMEVDDRKLERLHELAILDKEADTAERRAKWSLEETSLKGELNAFLESIKSDQAKYATAGVLGNMPDGKAKSAAIFLLVAVDFCRGMTRPVITWISTYLVVSVWWRVSGSLFEKIAEDKGTATAIAYRSLDMIFFVAGMSIGWWFGSRPQKPPRRDGQPGSAIEIQAPM
mgnify:FL=1